MRKAPLRAESRDKRRREWPLAHTRAKRAGVDRRQIQRNYVHAYRIVMSRQSSNSCRGCGPNERSTLGPRYHCKNAGLPFPFDDRLRVKAEDAAPFVSGIK